MGSVIKVESGLEPFLARAATQLGLEVAIESTSSLTLNRAEIAITTIRSAQTQLATYPAVQIENYRNRVLTKPAYFQVEFLRGLQETVNQRSKSELNGVVQTYRFNLDGDLIEVMDVITVDAIWSIEFSVTSIFENVVRAAKNFPLGVTEMTAGDWVIINFEASQNLDMQQPYLHLFAHEPRYRINKATNHVGYVALREVANSSEKVCHAVDYLEGVVSE